MPDIVKTSYVTRGESRHLEGGDQLPPDHKISFPIGEDTLEQVFSLTDYGSDRLHSDLVEAVNNVLRQHLK